MKFIQGIKNTYRYLTHVLLKKVLQLRFIEEKTCPNTGATWFNLHFESIETITRMVLKLIAHACSVLFYIFDDVLLLAQLKLLDPHALFDLKWELLRHILALFKNIMHLLSSLLEIRYLLSNEHKIEEVLEQYNHIKITQNGHRMSMHKIELGLVSEE